MGTHLINQKFIPNLLLMILVYCENNIVIFIGRIRNIVFFLICITKRYKRQCDYGKQVFCPIRET